MVGPLSAPRRTFGPCWPSKCAHLAWVTLLGLASVAPAGAVVDISEATWTLPPSVPGRVEVVFTATVSAADLSNGVHFTLALHDGVSPHPLVHYATAAVPNLPDAGEPTLFRAVFDLDCGGGMVRGTPVEAAARFCTAGDGFKWNPLPGTPQPDSTTASGAFGLAILDENGAVGVDATPLDALTCGGATAASARAMPMRNVPPQRIQDGPASASIGIYFDPEATQCQGTISPGSIDTVYVCAKLGADDDSDCGIAGAEFRFAGIPESWHTSPVLHSDLLGIGNPFEEGVTVVSAQCRRPANGVVLLFTVLVLADAGVPDVTFTIEGRQPPTNSLFPCPLVLACDDPVFTKICVQAEPCFVNPTVPRKCAAPTAVAPMTWSQLKALYR